MLSKEEKEFEELCDEVYQEAYFEAIGMGYYHEDAHEYAAEKVDELYYQEKGGRKC